MHLKGSHQIELLLRQSGIKYEKEYKFHDKRKWRFDFVIMQNCKKIAIEYEGINSEKSRHTTLGGYSEDCIKYNEAQILGWTVLRYTLNTIPLLLEDLNRCLH